MAGLFGRKPHPTGIPLMERLSMASRAAQGGPAIHDQFRARQQEMQQQVIADRLRSQLSPADGPNGSGTGAAPDLQSQMSALEDARLLNPAVAQQFAPIVAERERRAQARGLFGNDPKAQMLFTQGNEAFLNSLGEQYKPQVIGAGGRQSVYGEGRTVDAPSFSTVNDTIFRNDPGGGQSTPTATAAPAYADVTGRMNANTTQELGRGRLALDEKTAGFTLSPGQQRFGVNGEPLAGVAAPANPADNEDRAAISGFASTNARLGGILGMLGRPARDGQPAVPAQFDLSPAKALGYKAALATGIGMSPEAAAYGTYSSEIDAVVSDSLRLNTGPQTDQDAIRETRALLANRDNPDYVRSRIPVVMAHNDRLAGARQATLQQRTPQGQPLQQGGGAVTVSTPAQAQALAPGTRYRTPDGQEYIR